GLDQLDEAGRRQLALKKHRNLVHLAHDPVFDQELDDLRIAPDDVLDLRRVEVHTADREHVIDAAQDPASQLQEAAAAGARVRRQLDAVAGSIAHQGRAPAPEVGGDQLALVDLEDELGLNQVHTVAR